MNVLDLLSIPQSGGEMSKRLGGIIGCKYKTSSWHLTGSPMVVTLLGQHYNTGEKPTVILYTYYVVVVFTLLCKNSDIKNSITVGFSSILYY